MTDQPSGKPLARRPLLGVAAGYTCGIVAGVVAVNCPLLPLFFLALTALLFSLFGNLAGRRLEATKLIARTVSVFSGLFLYLAILLSAWLSMGLNLSAPSGRELGKLMKAAREGVELVGVITDDPVLRSAGVENRRTWTFPLRVEMIRRLPDWQTARGAVQVVLPEPLADKAPDYGQRWQLTGVLRDNARFPEERPIQEWMKNRYFFRAEVGGNICLSEDQGARLMSWCYRLRRQAAEYLERGIEHRPEIVGLLRALLLGYRQELADKHRRDFIATGTYHIFAISGQHVAILALFIIVVLQAQRVCRRQWFWYVAPVLSVFTFSTGLSSSAVRGCLMALLVFLGPLLQRQPDLPSAMALAAIIILAVAPLQLFDYGFLLSFAVVAGLIIFCPPLMQAAERHLAPDPWRLQPEPPAVQFWRNLARWAALLLVSSFAAWLVSTPLVARWFNLVSPIALLANLAVIPISTLVLLGACLAVLCGPVLPWLSGVFNFANLALVSFLFFLTDRMARIPWGHFFVVAPPVWAMFVWFATLLFWRFAQRRRWLVLIGAAILIVALLAQVIANRNRVSVDVINVGAMPVCLVKAPGAAPALVHAGSRFYARQELQSLQRRGVNRLSALVLPAADAQHTGGALEVLGAMPVSELWCASTNARSPVFQQALTQARDQGILLRELANGEQGSFGNDLSWQYDAAASEFRLRRGATELTIGWGQAPGGPGEPEGVRVECAAASGAPTRWQIHCFEFGATAMEMAGTNALMTMNLAPRQGVRIYLDETSCRLERWPPVIPKFFTHKRRIP